MAADPETLKRPAVRPRSEILHVYIPNLITGTWDHIGDPRKDPWEQMLWKRDLTISWYNMQEQINRLGRDMRNCTFGMNTLTGAHFVKLLAIAVDKEVPLHIEMSESELASARRMWDTADWTRKPAMIW